MSNATKRVFPPAAVTTTVIVIHGRTYTGTAGTAVTMPVDDANIACANGWTEVPSWYDVAVVGPQGAQGSPGAQGSQGAQGAQGAPA